MSADASAILALLLYAAVAGVVIVIQARTTADNWRIWMLHVIARTYTPFMFRQRLSQPCPLPAAGPALLIGNHRSPVDPMLIFSTVGIRSDRYRIRAPEFLTATEYTEIGGAIGFICRTLGTIPVDRDGRDMESAKRALRRLQAGRIVGIFPEGRINTGPGLLPPIPGVGWLALKGGAPVYPVYVHDAPQAKGMVAPFITRTKARVIYGEPIDLSQFAKQRVTAELLAEVTSLLMDKLAETGGLKRPQLSIVADDSTEQRNSA
jgi:1-acyl-sn-glycerol-3-phosphate acyltransferase